MKHRNERKVLEVDVSEDEREERKEREIRTRIGKNVFLDDDRIFFLAAYDLKQGF